MSLECVMGFACNRKKYAKGPTTPLPPKPIAKHESYPCNAEEARAYVLSFGKHQGLPISKAPRTYLRWLLRDHGPQEGQIPHIAKVAARLLLESQ